MSRILAIQQLVADPVYANMTDDVIASILNAKTITAQRENRLTALGVMKVLGATAGASVLDALNAVGQTNSAVKWAMMGITTQGVDMGDANTRSMLDALAAGSIISQADADALKATADILISPGEQAGLGYIYPAEIKFARTGNY